MMRTVVFSLFFLAAAAIPVSVNGQQGGGAGRGPGRGHDERHQDDHEVFQFLLSHHDQIHRTVRKLPNGVETITESDVPEVTEKIQEHVMWMEHRISETKPIRMRDPLFAELFQHTKKIDMQYEQTERGVRVVETSADPYVAQLIQAHADVVSGFVARGFTEAMKNHPVPQTANSKTPQHTDLMYPSIQGYGGVVQLVAAAQQPRSGSRILVDITQGGDPDKLNSAFDKVARFVNIYQGAGKKPADVQVAVILHGAATLSILDADSYAARFGTAGNPNSDCLHKLHEAGVEIYVCGQSLAHKQARPDQALVFVDVAVSALTTVVNLQSDGYVRIPL